MNRSGFKLSTRSQERLRGVHPYLIDLVTYAIDITSVDFGVLSGVRTEEEQRLLVERGVSKTMDSKHLRGHAVDLVPYIDGKPVFELVPAMHVAAVMWRAVDAVKAPDNVSVVWGGAWNQMLREAALFGEDYEAAIVTAMLRKREQGKYFVDAFHFEIKG